MIRVPSNAQVEPSDITPALHAAIDRANTLMRRADSPLRYSNEATLLICDDDGWAVYAVDRSGTVMEPGALFLDDAGQYFVLMACEEGRL